MSNIDVPEPLSAKDKNSFAYKTLCYRLPIIITKVIDLLCRERKTIIKNDLKLIQSEQQQAEAEEEIKQLIEKLAKLKYELQTNKKILYLKSNYNDNDDWNKCIKLEYNQYNYNDNNDNDDNNFIYFNVSWLLSECYFYRMMYEIFFESKYFKNFDQFFSIKIESFKTCLNLAELLAKNLLKLIVDNNVKNNEEIFNYYTMNSLWGNKFDLSLSCGNSCGNNDNDNNNNSNDKILSNDLKLFYQFMKQLSKQQQQQHEDKIRIDVILDNAGFELFTDLCWLEAMHSINFLPKNQTIIYLHVKCIPWFVSDTMKTDILWLLNFIDTSLNDDEYKNLKIINKIFMKNFKNNLWIIEENNFWTLPCDYSSMSMISPELYENLSNKSNLLLFKGDLNYRKLVGDRKWSIQTPFQQALCKFQPKKSAICTLRTIKADVVVNINDPKIIEMIEQQEKLPKNWMEIGEYAVINFYKF